MRSNESALRAPIVAPEYLDTQDANTYAKSTTNDPFEAQRFLRAVYRTVLRREPDTAGLTTWTQRMMAGTTHAEVVELFHASEEYSQLSNPAANTPFFVPPGHFYSPIVNVAEADRHLAKLRSRPLPRDLPDTSIDPDAVVRTWNELLPFMTSAPFAEHPTAGTRYGFENPSYSWGDGSVLHAMLRRYRPKKVIEIGSGHSSACTLDTVDRYLNGNCELTFIEPYPELLLNLFGEAASRVRILGQGVQQTPLELFSELGEGDILFIDSTHVLRTGSDVCFELFEVLPRLAKGVLVHFHDMFWPFEYPRPWVVDENRSWNEIYAVRAFLTNNSAWQVLMFNDYLAVFERDMIEATYPAFLRNTGGALWIQRQ